MIEAIDNMGDVEEEDTDEEGNSTFKQSQPIQVYIQLHVVKWIQAGKFIDMAELLPDRLGIQVDTTKKDEKAPKIKRRQVTSMHTGMGTVLRHSYCYHLRQIFSANSGHAGLPGLNRGGLYGI